MALDLLSNIGESECLMDLLPILINKVGLPELRHFDLRRSPSGLADATLIPARDFTPSERRTLEHHLLQTGITESVQVQRNKITLRFRDEVITRLAETIPIRLGALFGLKNHLASQAFLVDFCDPNATKALHAGHLRNIALGNAVANCLRHAGAEVICQSVVCDIGRNVCEALAGYMQYGQGRTPENLQRKSDEFVGEMYATYVTSNPDVYRDKPGPDAPIARELVVGSDPAEHVLRRWRDGDPKIHSLWQQIVSWVVAGHNTTLQRLGLKLDRLVYESEGLHQVDEWISRGLSLKILLRLEDGAVAFPTGRIDYGQLLLLRPDGFPTEHMRALILWERMQDLGRNLQGCIHVMGREWLTTTQIRVEILRGLQPCSLFNRYHMLVHGMVTFQGEKMKSSTGEVLLIDEMLDFLYGHHSIVSAAEKSGLSQKDLSRIALLGCFLTTPADEEIEISWEMLVDPKRNPGLLLAIAWSECNPSKSTQMESSRTLNELRYAVLQAERFKGFLQRALENFDCHQLCRYLVRVAQWSLESRPDEATKLVIRELLGTGLKALGLAHQGTLNEV